MDAPQPIGIISINGFFVTMPLREFVSAGGELIIHAAAHLKNSPTPERIKYSPIIPLFCSADVSLSNSASGYHLNPAWVASV